MPQVIKASQLPAYMNDDGSCVYTFDDPFDGALTYFPDTRLWTGTEFEWREGSDGPDVKRVLLPAEALSVAAKLNLMIPSTKEARRMAKLI